MIIILSFLLSLTSTKGIPNGTQLYILSPYGDSQFVHPDIYYNANKWNGWEYWMAVTPYPYANAADENPSVYVSHDGINWSEPQGVVNPLLPTPPQGGHYDDPDIFVYKDTLHIWFLHSLGVATLLDLWSLDGKVWHGPDTLMYPCPPESLGASALRSPACHIVGDTIFMWYQSGTPNLPVPYIVALRKFVKGAFLPAIDTCIIKNIPHGKMPWHLDIEQSGGERMLLCYCDSGTYGVNTRIAIANRYSYNTWILDTSKIMNPSVSGWDNGEIYRSSLYIGDNYYKIWYSEKANNGTWGLGYVKVLEDICPPAPAESLKANGSNPSPWSSSPIFAVSWKSPFGSTGLIDSGITRALYKLGSAPVNNFDTTLARITIPTQLEHIDTVFSSAQGSTPLYIWLMDSLGNLSYSNDAEVSLRYDITPPAIRNTTKWDSTNLAGPFMVYSEITDENSGVGKAKLYYKISADSIWTPVLMSNNGDQYSGEIPAQADTTTISYYVYAEDKSDTSNKATDPPNAPSNYYSFTFCKVSEGGQANESLVSVLPNPFNKATTIKYDVPFEGRVYIKIYASSGNLVKTITSDVNPGRHFVKLETKNLSSGTYFMRLYAIPARPEYSQNKQYKVFKKLLLMK